MKQLFTLALCFAFYSLTYSQTLLWGGPNDPNSTFSGGLGSWTTTGLSSSNPALTANSIWNYTSNSSSKGAYSDQAGSINSPSKANGAMIFDSDFLDNGGILGNEGNGSSPSPHSGTLTSPNIDCSTFPTVTVSFYQYYQNYLSSCELQVSNDGGANWTSYPINGNIRPGTGTSRSNRQIIDISATAANQKSINFRFTFSGDYYFWIIDDVTLLSLPDNDLALTKVFYSPYSYAQPLSQICRDHFIFKAKISNLGAEPQSGVLFKSEIFSSNRTTRIFADSIYLVNNLKPTDDNIDVETPIGFNPTGLSIGKYYLRTSLTYNNTDYNAIDNVKLDSFEVTSNIFAREPRARIGNRANGGTPYTVCNQFRTSDCWNVNDKFFASRVEAGMIAGPLSANKDYTVRINVAEIKSEVADDFSNFDILHGVNSPSLIILSDQELKAKVQSTFGTYKLDLLNLTNEKLYLSKNTRYFIMCTHPPEANQDSSEYWRYHLCSNEKDYDGHPYAIPVIDNDGNWFETWPDGESPLLRVELDVITKNDDVPLPESVLIVQPNPIQNNTLSISLNFGKETNANITIFDLTGKVLDFQSFKNVKNNTLNLPVNDLSSGNYFVRVSTKVGTRTKKFIKL
ncbi:MAG: T9SS type A sorting domain-containing protein [Saprospiraceae bacterium]